MIENETVHYTTDAFFAPLWKQKRISKTVIFPLFKNIEEQMFDYESTLQKCCYTGSGQTGMLLL